MKSSRENLGPYGPPDNLTQTLTLRLVLLFTDDGLLLWSASVAGTAATGSGRSARVRDARRPVALRGPGVAAEFTHQIKNPLAIINNAAFSLQRALKQGKLVSAEQIRIIQEEVEHSDQIITQIMGYAQLSEGHVEKLNVIEELDQAIALVFPPAAGYPSESTEITRVNSPHVHAAPPSSGHLCKPAAECARSPRGQGRQHLRQREVPRRLLCRGNHSRRWPRHSARQTREGF